MLKIEEKDRRRKQVKPCSTCLALISKNFKESSCKIICGKTELSNLINMFVGTK